MKKSYIFLFLTVLVIMACADSKESHKTTISGEIINPYENYLVISKNNTVIDTVLLDKNHQFYYQFKTVENGLYTLRHGFETQKFYIQANDSVAMHLNTRKFDESLMYSGSEAAANNFLMQLFLDNEQNNKVFLSYYKHNPTEFAEETDSIRASHLEKFKRLQDKNNFSEEFQHVAKSIIDYAYYDLRERYFFLVNKYNRNFKKQLPDDFLAYRKSVNFNEKELQTYYIYQHFIENYLKNKSIEDCQHQNKEKNCFALKTRASCVRRLKLSDSLFKLKNLRALFIGRFASESIIFSNTGQAVDSTLSFLNDINYDGENRAMIERLAKVQKSDFIDHIGERQLLTLSKNKRRLESVLKKPSILFYWSLYYPAHQKNAHQQIQILRKRYPDMNFIALNIDCGEFEIWKTSVKNFNYDQKFEYQIVCPPNTKNLYRNYLNKLLFVNKEGKILEGNLDLQDHQLENKILALLNR